MNVLKFKDNEELSAKAAEVIVGKIKSLSSPTIGLATGSTPERMYEILVEKYKNGEVSFADVTTFNLDEYIGLDPSHINSYHHYMNERLFDHIDINKANTFIPNGLAENPEDECNRFEKLITEKDSIDLQVLGLGLNGHIGFNEPGTAFDARTHVVELVESTRNANARFFDHIDEVPTHAISMGIGTILDAKEIILLVQGDAKSSILHDVVHGPITEDVPASILQKHPKVTVITDIDV